ncbi:MULTISPECIES: hypothetical protein [unclassified Motilimonas]|uniref:hypothetical protein n=1 Tax=Motilimonas TaxID=1914248 RepID=UPI001E337933|nr:MULTISPECIES: hypothetical protein [unclassified Motilimonas]MCE0555644.1 hypothetical protein [Motilimonas sp. E26]MDO6526678.1 hypothetical protein [Motilimonas sp. 1_MG-2023]
MLSKVTYEVLPSTYLLTGIGSISMLEPYYGVIAGFILYSIGALIWVMRSNYRRKDEHRKPTRTHFVWPEWLYEFTPFILIAGAAWLLQAIPETGTMVAATAIVLYALHKLYQRYQHRQHEWQEISIYAPTRRSSNRKIDQ